MGRTLLLLLTVCISLALPVAAFSEPNGSVQGKVNYQGKPLEGAYVRLYSDYKGGFHDKADYEAGPTGPDGVFSVAVANGKYYLIASKSLGDKAGALKPGDFYAFYGGNPVMVSEGETIHVGVNCAPIIDAGQAKAEGGTGIRGKVFGDGKPLSRARVTLYQDGETIFRGIGYASVLTNDTGEFSFNLEPGAYYVVARKRAGDDKMGPLTAGDLFAYAHENPVTVSDGAYTVIAMNAVTKLIKVKEGGQEVTLGGTVKAGSTVVEGVVKDKDGHAVAGVYASAYRDSMMTQKPDFISKVTGPDGKYSISLSEGGEYFIMARDTIGGPAEHGDLLGRYNGNEDHSVKVKTGDRITGIDVVVEKVE